MTVGVPAEGPYGDEDGVGRWLPMELMKETWEWHHMRLQEQLSNLGGWDSSQCFTGSSTRTRGGVVCGMAG